MLDYSLFLKSQHPLGKLLKKAHVPDQLLGENKPYSLNSTYNFCTLKNLQFRFSGQKMADSVTDHRACSNSSAYM